MIDTSILNAGSNINCIGLGVTLHQPTIREIAELGGENNFFLGCSMLLFIKDTLQSVSVDNLDLSSLNDFDIIMTILGQEDALKQSKILSMITIFVLIFPQ